MERLAGIGGTDAASLMGVGRKSLYELWEEKGNLGECLEGDILYFRFEEAEELRGKCCH